jgi:hypothetical protein
MCSSSLASHFGCIDALRWTPRLEEALGILQMNKSCSTDETLAFQVRLQLLMQRAAHIREQHEADQSLMGVAPTATSMSSFLYLKALRGELQQLKDSISSDCQIQRRLCDMGISGLIDPRT